MYCIWRPLLQELPRTIRIYLIFLETTTIGLHFAADNISLSSLQFSWWAPEILLISAKMKFPPFKIIQSHWCWYPIESTCDFLLVRNSNLGHILHHFEDFAAFMCSWPHPYSTLIWTVFLLHQIAHVAVSKRIGLKLFGREIIFKEFQPMWSRYPNVTDGRTDRQMTCSFITALCIASRDKNRQNMYSK